MTIPNLAHNNLSHQAQVKSGYLCRSGGEEIKEVWSVYNVIDSKNSLEKEENCMDNSSNVT